MGGQSAGATSFPPARTSTAPDDAVTSHHPQTLAKLGEEGGGHKSPALCFSPSCLIVSVLKKMQTRIYSSEENRIEKANDM